MSNQITTFKWNNLYSAIAALVLGILFIVVPVESVAIICVIVGIALIAAAGGFAYVFFKYKGLNQLALVLAVTLAIIGLFFITNTEVIGKVLSVAVGVIIIIDATASLYESILMLRANIAGWPIMIGISIVCLILGIVTLFGSHDIVILAGIMLIIDGICDAAISLLFTKRVMIAKRKINKNTIYVDNDNDNK